MAPDRIFLRHTTRTLLAFILLAATATTVASAEDAAPKAFIAIVGDVDRFNIGQDGYCGKRNDIESPEGAKFKIPANQQTFFYVRSRRWVGSGNNTCEGDYSFLPEPGQLYMIRLTTLGRQCHLEMFQSDPGATPRPIGVTRAPLRSCLGT